jgi:Uncharacterized conserved protein
MPGKFVIKKAKNGQYMFNLHAGNGEVILTSEMYKERGSAVNGVASVQKNAGDDKRYAKETAKNGKFYFKLKAANHQVIGMSEMYDSESNRDNGIESVKKNAPGAPTDDQSQNG